MAKRTIKPLPPTDAPLEPVFHPAPKKFKNRMTLKQKRIIVAYAKTGSNKKAAELAKASAAYVGVVVNSPRGRIELQPVIDAIASHRNAVLLDLRRRESSFFQEDYKTMLSALDITTKNHQLLSGGATENVAVADVTEKYNELINAVKNGKEIE